MLPSPSEGGRGAADKLLTMTLIAKDEAENIDRCFSSWWSAVDEVILCDTGSTDRTVQKAREFADRKGEADKLKVIDFDWCQDFAAARNHADRFATGKWLVWCDLDDTVHGLGRLREMAEHADDEVVAFFCHYQYARDEHGNTISELWRERVVRNDGVPWQGRLHEHKLFLQGAIVRVSPDAADWVHHRNHHDERTGDRNLEILNAWLEDEPTNARVIHSIGMEHMGVQNFQQCAAAFTRYLLCPGETPDRRAQASRYLAATLLQMGRTADAKKVALDSLGELWGWADTHLSMAEIAQTEGRPQDGYLHAETALRIGKPETLLIVNPLQYTVHPKAVMAVCCAQMGRFVEAVRLADEVLEHAPSYQLAAQNVPLWRGALKKEQTVLGFLSSAQLLTAHGELLKAVKLFDCVPVYAHDDPRIVERRVELARQVRETMTRALEPVNGEAEAFLVSQLEELAGDAG